MRLSVAALFALFSFCVLPLAAAQSWPDRPVEIVVPCPPGGATGAIATRAGIVKAAAIQTE